METEAAQIVYLAVRAGDVWGG